MGGNRHKVGIVPRLVRQHPYEHSVVGKPQDKNNVPNDNHITEFVRDVLRIGTPQFSHKEVGTHSLQYGFYLEIFLARVYPEIIMIIGLCSRNSFLRYIRIQVSNLSKGIRDIMVSTRAFYRIP